ncbi:hypothetical protein, partial [Pseudomonas sp. Sample_22]|uniref:hypothetical protein n=1 Tax=Pseudomonas sp. Sample_22 TaxID=2448266 RepID=UPI0019D56E5F
CVVCGVWCVVCGVWCVVWRASLLALGCAAAPGFCERYALKREQARSPQLHSPKDNWRASSMSPEFGSKYQRY